MERVEMKRKKMKKKFRSFGSIVASRVVFSVAAVLVGTLIVATYFVSKIINDNYQNMLEMSVQGVAWDLKAIEEDMRRDLELYVKMKRIPLTLDFILEDGKPVYSSFRKKLSPEVYQKIYSSTGFGSFGNIVYWVIRRENLVGGLFIDDRIIRRLLRDIRGNGLIAVKVGETLVYPSFLTKIPDTRKAIEELKTKIGMFDTIFGDQHYIVKTIVKDQMIVYTMLSTGLFDDVVKSLFITLVVMFSAGIAVIFYASKSIGAYLTRNLRMILDGFEKLREGTFEFLDIKTQDELGMIMAEFNVTIAVLKDAMEKLKLAKEMAEEASKSKSMFLASVSHEIRTPLNSILGFTELLLKEEKDPRKREYLATIYKSGEHLLNVINDILDLSKIEAGKMELVFEEYNPVKLVEEVVKMYQPVAMKKGINIFSEIKDSVPNHAVGDVFRIKQILINLVSNAVKFTEQGYVKIGLKREGDNLLYTVEDTGIGIPKDKVDRIFEPFTQADSTVARKFGGTGLGLTISKKLAKMMRGDLWIESELGRGTKVYLKIPIEVVSTREIARRSETKISERLAFVHLKTESLRENVVSLLNDLGFEIEELPSMREVYMRLATVKPRLTFVEVSSTEDVKGILRELTTIAFLPPSSKRLMINQAHFFPSDVNFEDFLSEFQEITGIRFNEHLRILLVEDNEVNRKLVENMLVNVLKSYELDSAENGQEALDLVVSSGGYDLILMDAQMPVMDGYTATKRLREMGFKGVIVMATASVADMDVKKAFDSGCDDFLPKPIRLEELKLKIWKYYPKAVLLSTERKVENVASKEDSGNGQSEITGAELEEFTKFLRDEGAVEKSMGKLVEEMGMDKELAFGMVKDYVSFLKNKLSLLEKAVESKDEMGVRRVAHDLQGSGEMYGFDMITELGKTLSDKAKKGDFDSLEKLVEVFKKMVENYEKDMVQS